MNSRKLPSTSRRSLITANSDQTRYKSNKLKLLSMKDYIWQRIH
jgi:hypothetical protein